ncbi:hypothetical protein D3C76_1733230 [compost metagenome]
MAGEDLQWLGGACADRQVYACLEQLLRQGAADAVAGAGEPVASWSCEAHAALLVWHDFHPESRWALPCVRLAIQTSRFQACWQVLEGGQGAFA